MNRNKKKLFPSIKQFKKWSLPAKITVVSGYVTILGFIINFLLLPIYKNVLNPPSHAPPPPKNHSEDEKDYLAFIEKFNIEDSISKFPELYNLAEQLKSAVQRANTKVNRKKIRIIKRVNTPKNNKSFTDAYSISVSVKQIINKPEITISLDMIENKAKSEKVILANAMVKWNSETGNLENSVQYLADKLVEQLNKVYLLKMKITPKDVNIYVDDKLIGANRASEFCSVYLRAGPHIVRYIKGAKKREETIKIPDRKHLSRDWENLEGR
jgi:hypothetical protein